MPAAGRPFFKMCGSGNDFVFFDARAEPAGALAGEAEIRRLCARATGIGADGVVFVEPSAVGAVRMAYYNSDGSRATLCGNATLCTTSLAVELGAAPASGFVIETDAGPIRARIRNGQPEIELPALRALTPDAAGIAAEPGEARIGFAVAGVPHLVVRVADAESVDLPTRGRALRFDPTLEAGANVNFVSPAAGGRWRMRTYERGVEGETLACGTGAVACAAVLAAWSEVGSAVELVTSSGRLVTVTPAVEPLAGRPTLAGEGRLVFAGRLGDLG
ncbi:diaminopimelate epimerase [Roseisolibacter sp. H3M3-2]|uniref:diaminopimelate epimerase n=1 Tax=Roseisolibacter sp. H3M3-2 TaxID=3031323 RepID=UPI0023D98E64|nr:diaminopimelate epimerase [Roseisolibacter sp. H3M3-2]MDF1502628.1 diaminopimelate epimerase [Roseisolibacter sp. H3M3-2]